MVKIFDYIFWRFYCFFCKHKFFRTMEDFDAATMIFFLFGVPPCALLGYITRLGYLPTIGNSRGETRFLMTLMLLPVYILTTYRYLFYSKIKKIITKYFARNGVTNHLLFVIAENGALLSYICLVVLFYHLSYFCYHE